MLGVVFRAVANFGVKFGKRGASPLSGNKHLPSAFPHWKIGKGDLVEVIEGPEKGRQGKVLGIKRKANMVEVEGVNSRLVLAREDGSQKKMKFMPIGVWKVALVDPTTKKPGKVCFGYTEEGQKVRVFKESGALLPKLKPYANREERVAKRTDSPLDTPGERVLEVTYQGEDFAGIRAKFEEMIREKEAKEQLLVFK